MTKLTDTQAACNIIKRKREYARKSKGKEIRTSLKIDNTNLACVTNVGYNPCTENYTIRSHGIKCKKNTIYPTIHQKLKCTNTHALDLLNKSREYCKTYDKDYRQQNKEEISKRKKKYYQEHKKRN